MSIDSLEYDFIDVHYHVAPDLYRRRHNALAAGQIYKKLGGAVVLKSHLGSTASLATAMQQAELPVFPSLVLNQIAGGIHYKTVLQALAEYQPVIPSKMIVHFPTITGRQHRSKLSRKLVYPAYEKLLMQPETVFDDENRLRQEVLDVIKLSIDYPIVLSTGHASADEVYALVEACDKLGAPALMLNQPANPLTNLSADALMQFAKHPFVWVEQTALTFLLTYQDSTDFYKVLKNVSNVIYSSDLGQTQQIDLHDWLEKTKAWFSSAQLSTERREEICLKNPRCLLKI